MAKRAVVPCEGPRRLKESTCRKLGIRAVSHQEEGRWKGATKRVEGSHYVATKLVGATFYSRPSGNHDRPAGASAVQHHRQLGIKICDLMR